MPPLNSIDTWSERTHAHLRRPKAKCFLIGEGANTEFWYLETLAHRLAREGKPELIELKPVQRTGVQRNQSSPRKLAEHAKEIREDAEGIHGFDPDTDRVVIVFDADVYKGDVEGYHADLAAFGKVAQVAVAYPSFELFLLLHADNAYEKVIKPHEQGIIENGYVTGHRRYVEKLACDTLGINVKHNHGVGELSARFEQAVEEEKHLNQDAAKAVGTLSSNVGAILSGVISEGSADEACEQSH